MLDISLAALVAFFMGTQMGFAPEIALGGTVLMLMLRGVWWVIFQEDYDE